MPAGQAQGHLGIPEAAQTLSCIGPLACFCWPFLYALGMREVLSMLPCESPGCTDHGSCFLPACCCLRRCMAVLFDFSCVCLQDVAQQMRSAACLGTVTKAVLLLLLSVACPSCRTWSPSNKTVMLAVFLWIPNRRTHTFVHLCRTCSRARSICALKPCSLQA